jgi:hypothetical protein
LKWLAHQETTGPALDLSTAKKLEELKKALFESAKKGGRKNAEKFEIAWDEKVEELKLPKTSDIISYSSKNSSV